MFYLLVLYQLSYFPLWGKIGVEPTTASSNKVCD